MGIGGQKKAFAGIIVPEDYTGQKQSVDPEEARKRYEDSLSKSPINQTNPQTLNYILVKKKMPVPVVKHVTIASTQEAIDKYYEEPMTIMVKLPQNEYLVIELDANYATPKMQKENDEFRNEMLKYNQLLDRSRTALRQIKEEYDKLTIEIANLRIKAGVLDRLEPFLKNIFESMTIAPKKKLPRRRTKGNKL